MENMPGTEDAGQKSVGGSFSSMLVRSAAVAWLIAERAAVVLVAMPWIALRKGRSAVSPFLYRQFVILVERLGPTFIKFGQILSSRRDVLPPGLCMALAALHDQVPAMSEAEVRQSIAQAYPRTREQVAGDGFRYEDLALCASGSIASVYHAVAADGTEVALKLRRPGIEKVMATDLAILEHLVRLSEHLPQFRGMPLGDLVAYVSDAILGQLDFVAEAENLARIHASLASFPGVLVPAPLPALCRANCLVMEFLPGLHGNTLDALTRQQRLSIAETALMAVGQLMFRDGFAHCDLHPGNLYVRATGELIILDAGYSVPLTETVRLLLGEFFFCMATRKGRRCAEIILESAAHIRAGADIDNFIAAMDALVQKQTHASFLSMASFGNEIFELQQKFGLYAKSDFAFPMMALGVLEGTLRQLNPEVDFMQLGNAAMPDSRLALV